MFIESSDLILFSLVLAKFMPDLVIKPLQTLTVSVRKTTSFILKRSL